MKNILFICTANQKRSNTAEDHFSAKYPNLNFSSAGTNIKMCQKIDTNPLTEDILDWAEQIFVMENKHRKFINQFSRKKHGKKITVLGVPDVYRYYEKELIDILEEKVEQNGGLE